MNFTERLLEKTTDIWEEYYKHPFVLGIQNGNLDHAKFRYYILQDYLYLEEYLKVFALGVAKSRSVETCHLFAGYIENITHSEMDIHRGYMGELEISAEELQHAKRALDNLSYTSYMLRLGYEEDELAILISILACALSYEYIGKRIVKNNPAILEDPFFGPWVAGYSSEDYTRENLLLTEQVERLAKGCDEERLDYLTEIFVNCSAYELEFWNFSWKGENKA